MTTSIDVAVALPTPVAARRTGFLRHLWKVLLRKPSRMVGAAVVVLFILAALLGPLLYPGQLATDPDQLFAERQLGAPAGHRF